MPAALLFLFCSVKLNTAFVFRFFHFLRADFSLYFVLLMHKLQGLLRPCAHPAFSVAFFICRCTRLGFAFFSIPHDAATDGLNTIFPEFVRKNA